MDDLFKELDKRDIDQELYFKYAWSLTHEKTRKKCEDTGILYVLMKTELWLFILFKWNNSFLFESTALNFFFKGNGIIGAN